MNANCPTCVTNIIDRYRGCGVWDLLNRPDNSKLRPLFASGMCDINAWEIQCEH